jgi:hypothetical protein
MTTTTTPPLMTEFSNPTAGLWVARQLTGQLELVSSLDGASVRLWV